MNLSMCVPYSTLIVMKQAGDEEFFDITHISDCHVQRVYVCTTEFKERKKERIFIFFHNAHTYKGNWLYSMYMNVDYLYVGLRIVNTSTPCETFVRHTEGGCLRCLMLMLCAGRKWIAVTYAGPPPRIAQSGPVSPNQGPYRPIRARLAGQWEAGLKNIWIICISGRRRGGIVWVNPSSKCASCHSHEMHQRIIHTHVNVSSKAYVYDDTIYNFCARARFAGCSYLRHIILGLNTVS